MPPFLKLSKKPGPTCKPIQKTKRISPKSCIKVRMLKQCYWFIKAKDVHYQKQRSILTSSIVVTVVGKIPTTTAVGKSSIKMERLNISLIKMTLEYIQLHLAVPNGPLS